LIRNISHVVLGVVLSKEHLRFKPFYDNRDVIVLQEAVRVVGSR